MIDAQSKVITSCPRLVLFFQVSALSNIAVCHMTATGNIQQVIDKATQARLYQSSLKKWYVSARK